MYGIGFSVFVSATIRLCIRKTLRITKSCRIVMELLVVWKSTFETVCKATKRKKKSSLVYSRMNKFARYFHYCQSGVMPGLKVLQYRNTCEEGMARSQGQVDSQ